MKPSYLRLRRPLPEALARSGAWIGAPELAPPREVAEREAIDLALTDGQWKGLAVSIYFSGPWTVFEEVSGGLAARPAEDWVRLADGGDLVYAGYNDAISYAELVVIEGGRLLRHFVQDEQDPSADVNVGTLPEEADEHWRTGSMWPVVDPSSRARHVMRQV